MNKGFFKKGLHIFMCGLLGAAVLIAHCKAIGVDSVVQDSSGNAGNSVAAYSGKAGINCEIFVPEGTSPKKIDMIRAHGATCTVVPGSRDHCADVCRSKVDTDNCYYANHVYNPYFYEGTKTYIYEVFEQLRRMPKHLVIPVGNGTDALQIALMALGLKPGDEVITPTFTFIATAEVVALLGLKPVVVDVDWDTMNISIDALRQAITPKTKAIVPVHLFGQCADMEAIMSIAQEHGLYVVEDACQAIGAKYTFSDGNIRQAATIGHIGCTSFFPSKNLGCYGDGGAIFTNNDELASKMRAIANHGMVVRYHHDQVGVNSRLDSIQAAILDIKLPHLDEYIEARQRAAAYYDKAFTYSSKNQSAFNFFINDNAVCAGFAKSAQIVFQNIGIESYTITGYTSARHMWNIVKYNDKYYYLDTTVANSAKVGESIYYEGLNQEFMNDYKVEHSSWYPRTENKNMFKNLK